MNAPLPTETVVYERNQKLWWKATGYGYKGRIPVVFIKMSASGKRALVKFQTRDFFGQINGAMSSYISPEKLELRNE